MTTANYMTLQDFEVALDKALKPVRDDLQGVRNRLDSMEGTLTHVRAGTNQMYDALASHGLPLPSRTE